MRILQIDPGCEPEVKEIGPGLTAMQEVVGGLIQVLYPFKDPVALIANDEGKLLDLPANRTLRGRRGEPCGILHGTFFLCGAPVGGRFTSLTDRQVKKYGALFRRPELFLNLGGQIIVLPCD